jgi:hypothetical protein
MRGVVAFTRADDRAICNTMRVRLVTLRAKRVHQVTELHVRNARTCDPARYGAPAREPFIWSACEGPADVHVGATAHTQPHPLMRHLFLALASTLVLAGCSDDDSPTPPTPTPSIALAVSPTDPTLRAGGAPASITITVTRNAGYTGPVDLVLEGLPTGITGTLTPQQIPAGATTAQLQLTAVATVPAGSVTFTVRGNGTGIQPQTASVALAVTAAAIAGYSFALTPDTISLRQGQAGSVAIRLTRTTGFTGGVTFVADSVPAGLTAAIVPTTPVTGDTARLNVSAGATAAAGSFTLRVRGSATGTTDSTKTLRVTVTASGGITLTSVPATLTAAPGDTARATLRITRTAPFAGAVTLAPDTTLPAGLSATFTPATIPAGADSARIAIAIGATADTGQRIIRLRATGDGVSNAVATITLAVRPTQGFSFTAPTDTLRAVQGGSVRGALRITRTGGFAGPVTFTADSLPTGVAATFAPPSPVAGDTTGVTFAVGATAAAGSYAIPIRATAAGLPTVSRTVRLVVSATGSIAVRLDPDSIAGAPRDTIRTLIRVTRTAPFAGVVRIGLDTALRAGVTAQFARDSLLANQDTVTLRLIVTDTTIAGRVPFAVRATGTGVANARAAGVITVGPRAAAGFTLRGAPDTLVVAQGASGTSTITITRDMGFTAPVTITTTGAPMGVTATVTGSPVMGTSATIAYAAAMTAAVGTTSITVTGTATGATTRTATFVLRVRAP